MDHHLVETWQHETRIKATIRLDEVKMEPSLFFLFTFDQRF